MAIEKSTATAQSPRDSFENTVMFSNKQLRFICFSLLSASTQRNTEPAEISLYMSKSPAEPQMWGRSSRWDSSRTFSKATLEITLISMARCQLEKHVNHTITVNAVSNHNGLQMIDYQIIKNYYKKIIIMFKKGLNLKNSFTQYLLSLNVSMWFWSK